MLLRQDQQASSGDGLSFITTTAQLGIETREQSQTRSQTRRYADAEFYGEPIYIPLDTISIPESTTRITGITKTTSPGGSIEDLPRGGTAPSSNITASGPSSFSSSLSSEGGESIITNTTALSTIRSNISSTPNKHESQNLGNATGILQDTGDEQGEGNLNQHSPNPSTSTRRTVQWDILPPSLTRRDGQAVQLSGRERRREEKERERRAYENRSQVLERGKH